MRRLENAFKVVEHTDAMLAYWDKNLVCKFANAAYIKWFGLSPTALIDKITLPELLGSLYEKNRPYVNQALAGKIQIFERDIILPSGETRHTIATYRPDIFRGAVAGFFVHVADISQLKNPSYKPDNNIENYVAISANDYLTAIENELRLSIFTRFPGITQLAKAHFTSPTKLKTEFKNKYKKSIFSYYRSLQMHAAHKYVSEKIYSKKQMADILGFKNPSNFLACYKKYFKEITTTPDSIQLQSINTPKSEQRDADIIANVPIALAMFDLDFHLLGASNKWKKENKIKNKELTGKSIHAFLPTTALQWKEICLTALKNKNTSGTAVFELEDGSVVWRKWEIATFKNKVKPVAGFIIVSENIIPGKSVQETATKESDIFQICSEHLGIGTWERNFETGVTTWNKVCKKILELPESYEPDKIPALNFYKEGADREFGKKCLNEALIKGQSFDIEMKIVTARGNEKNARITCFSQVENGICKRLFGTFHEIASDSLKKNAS